MLYRLTGSAQKYAEIIELDEVRRSTGENRETREGMVAGVKYLLKSLERQPWEWRRPRRKDKSRSSVGKTPKTSRTTHGRLGQRL